MGNARARFSEAEKGRTGQGRYEQVSSARAPANGVARPVPSLNVRTALAAVPDPMDLKQRIQVTVNYLTDILESERKHGRITESAYRVGLRIQAAYGGEIGKIGKTGLYVRVDQSRDPDNSMVGALDRADDRVALQRHIEHLVGVIGAKMLRLILVEGYSFSAYAAQVAKRPGERGTAYVAGRFRSLLEEMAESWAARG